MPDLIKLCEHCESIVELPQATTARRQQGSVKCPVCEALLHEWDGTYSYDHPIVRKRGPKAPVQATR